MVREFIKEAEKKVVAGELSPAAAADLVLSRYRAGEVRRAVPHYFHDRGTTRELLARAFAIARVIRRGGI